MTEVKAISTICETYNITSRTLRYYEEIGLITSIRKGDGNYRCYDEEMISRIEQILLMRRLSLSVKEIQSILTTNNINETLNIFMNKLNMLKEDLIKNVSVINDIEKMIRLIQMNRNLNHFSTLNKVLTMDNKKTEDVTGDILDNSDLLNKWNIRIIRLHPMRVAYYVAHSKQPEDDAWKVITKWVEKNQLDQLFTTRYFGFNNPNPTNLSSIYGYEVWITVDEQVKESEEIKIKTFPGGLYAVMTSNIVDIVKSWRKMYDLIDQSKNYQVGKRWLEEHLILEDTTWNQNFQVDLYCPLILKED
ncbi:effector binding domain-containing protein [Mycoplasmatota bacterium]|nr:effector binding domain-containing protein [Mycoplasmatota bacterium]